MSRPRRAGLAAFGLLAAALAVGSAPATAQPAGGGSPRAYLFLIDRVPFEAMLDVPEFAALARAGGAGLLAELAHPDDEGLGPYLSIGAGAKAAVPSSRIAPLPDRDAFPAETLAEIRALDDDVVPGLMAQVLKAAGRTVGVFGNADDRFGPNTPGLLTGMDVSGAAEGEVQGLVVPVPGRLGALRTDGRALLAEVERVAPDLAVIDAGDTHRIDQEAPYAPGEVAARDRTAALARMGSFVRGVLSRAEGEILVLVVTPTASQDMLDAGDAVTPILLARGRAEDLFPAEGDLRGLTSDSTRRDGLVAAQDVAPTILDFLGVRPPAEMTGHPIRVSGPAPFELHERHIGIRRLRVPVSLGLGLGGLVAGLGAGVAAMARRPLGRRVLSVAGATASVSTVVPLAILAGGLVPGLSLPVVLAVALSVAVLAGLGAWRWRREDPGFPVVLVAAASGLAVVVDGLLGWEATGLSLGGGTIFQGRAYGLRNVWLGPLLGGTVLVAARLRASAALAVGLGVAVFAGFPGLGADVGGYLALSAAAWLLYFSLSRGRVGWREAAIGALATAAGLVALLVVDALFNPTPTHAGRFAERVASDGLGTLVGVVGERLKLTVQLTSAVPVAWLLVAWFAYAAWIAPRVGGIVGAAFDRSPGYRDAMWVLAASTLIAVVVNDSGIGTAQTAAAYSIGGFVVPAVAHRLWLRDRSERVPRDVAAPVGAASA